MGENDLADILRFLESMDTPDLSRVQEFLKGRGVSAEKLRLAQDILEQMGIHYDSPPEETPDQDEVMSLFGQLSSHLDEQTRQRFAGLIDGSGQQAECLNSTEDVLDYLKKLKRD